MAKSLLLRTQLLIEEVFPDVFRHYGVDVHGSHSFLAIANAAPQGFMWQTSDAFEIQIEMDVMLRNPRSAEFHFGHLLQKY